MPLAKPVRPRRSSNISPQIFIGTIAKNGGQYVLMGSTLSTISGTFELQLDNQLEAAKFAGRQVKAEGILDESLSKLQILSIQFN